MTDIKENVLRVANSSYYAGPGSYQMWVMTDDGKKLEKRAVQLGESSPDHVEVLSGLAPGEKVVISDMTAYKNNSTLKLKK